MPGLVKVGYTTGTIQKRMNQLNTTSTPSPFEVSALFYVNNAVQCEKEIHNKLNCYRENPKREFFKNSVPQLVSESIMIIGNYIDSSILSKKNETKNFSPDDDDIYFMTYLLHDCYEKNQPYYTEQLAEHHDGYAPLELEIKLINLQHNGYVKRVNNETEGMGKWQILPKGVQFMLKGKHYFQDIIEEQRKPY